VNFATSSVRKLRINVLLRFIALLYIAHCPELVLLISHCCKVVMVCQSPRAFTQTKLALYEAINTAEGVNPKSFKVWENSERTNSFRGN